MSSKKKILITSGATIEPIDKVRFITNFSTGALGAKIAEAAANKGIEVVLVHGRNAVKPKTECRAIEVSSVKSAAIQIKQVLSSSNISAMIHLMAVSDFYVQSITTLKQIYHSAVQSGSFELFENEISSLNIPDGKISSKEKCLALFLPTTKILDHVREWAFNPALFLVSFKLLSNTTEQILIETAKEQLVRTKSNLVIGNMLEETSEKGHKAYFVEKSGVLQTAIGKAEIAEQIISRIDYL